MIEVPTGQKSEAVAELPDDIYEKEVERIMDNQVIEDYINEKVIREGKLKGKLDGKLEDKPEIAQFMLKKVLLKMMVAEKSAEDMRIMFDHAQLISRGRSSNLVNESLKVMKEHLDMLGVCS